LIFAERSHIILALREPLITVCFERLQHGLRVLSLPGMITSCA
jgi:hypothetical protein